MTSRESVKRALNFEALDTIPVENGVAHPLHTAHPSDVAWAPYRDPAGRSRGEINRTRRRMDIWGCIWKAGEDGVCGEVKESPLHGDWSRLQSLIGDLNRE